MLDRARFPEQVTVYRGLHGKAAQAVRATNPEPGDYYQDPAFASMSRDRTISDEFRGKKDGVLLIIKLAKGTKALDIEPLSRMRIEKELLLQHGIAMKVVRWDADAGVLEVEVAGDG